MVTVKGTVTEYVWSNPHVLVKVDAKDDSGNFLVLWGAGPTVLVWTHYEQTGAVVKNRV